MSPEQAAGRWDVVGRASDVYGLGAVLYTLLTGRAPLEKGNWPEMNQRIQRGDFPRPRQVRPGVPPALEAVCLKAMALEPSARYGSAEALAADIEHWLADEPVAAWPEPAWVRGWRWVRRHRSLVSAAAVLLVAGLAATVVGLVLLGRKNEEIAAKNAEVTAERNAAQEAAAAAQAINAFLTQDLLGRASPDINDRSRKLTVEELLHQAARKIEANPKFAGRPEVEATLRLTIGNTYYKLGNLPEAEKHLRRAVELRREALGPDRPETLAAQEALADFLNRGPERPADAEPLARQTWEARVRVLGPEHPDTLDSLDTYATALNGVHKTAEGIRLCRECLEARRGVLGPDHDATLTSMNNVAVRLCQQGERAEAILLQREVVRVRSRGVLKTEKYFQNVRNLANYLYLNGDLGEADALLRENLALCAQRFSADHPMADNLQNLQVRVWIDQGQLEPAARIGREVVDRRRRIYGAEHALTGHALADLGHALVGLGRYGDAEKALDEAGRILAKGTRYDPYYVAWAECWHGASLTGLGRHAEAEERLQAAERQLRETLMTPPRHLRQAREQLVKLYEAWGQPDQAARWHTGLKAVDPPAEKPKGP